jgi:hypothetical protein
MGVLPDFDAIGVGRGMMFEKAKSFNAPSGPRSGGTSGEERIGGRGARRAGDALRALEWSELTARLNAARDLRLLLRTESHTPIEPAAASFGDAAASYFALLDDSEPGVNRNALGQSKAFGATVDTSETAHKGNANGENARPVGVDTREPR